jgi:hypothetical protein
MSILKSVCVAVALSLVPLTMPASSHAQDLLSQDHVRRDLDSLHRQMEQAHFDLYARRDRMSYEAFLESLHREIDGPMTAAEAAILFQRYLAFGRVGHARTQAPLEHFVGHLGGGGRFLPIFIRVDGQRVLLTRTTDIDGRLRAGMEVVALNDQPISTWIDTASGYVSADRPEMAQAQLEESFPAILWFLAPEARSIRVLARDESGLEIQADVPAITISDLWAMDEAYPTPSPDLGAPRSWRMLDDTVAYLRPGPFIEIEAPPSESPTYDAATFSAFVDGAFTGLLAAGATDLIIDLRDNPGGDNSFSDLIVAWFADRPFRFASRFTLRASPQSKAWYADHSGPDDDPVTAALAAAEAAQPDGTRYVFDLPYVQPRPDRRFTGRVYVLVNRHSYSNAASMAAMIQDYGFGQIVGEPTADLATTYASVLAFSLPQTGVRVEYPKSYIVRPNGDESLAGVVPDHELARAPIAEAADVVLDQAAAWIRASRTGSAPAPGPRQSAE